MRNPNLFWLQSNDTPFGKENAISPIFTTKKAYQDWKKENNIKEGKNCVERNDKRLFNRH